MPLDGHSYLVAQGWGGKGTGLRQGAISRPLAIPQKKTLAGLGKDRDEAFPFWDHLFSAAAQSIQVKCHSDDEDEGDGVSAPKDDVIFKKTSTGILSTRRPIDGTPAHSGTATPNEFESNSQTSRLSLMAQAKRDAARRGLYSRFFRGPVLGPEITAEEEKRIESLISSALHGAEHSEINSVKVTEHIEVQLADAHVVVDLEVRRNSSKKRKTRDGDENAEEDENKAARKQRKSQKKREEKEAKEKVERGTKGKKKEKSKAVEMSASAESVEPPAAKKSKHSKRQQNERLSEDEDEERKRRRKEKKKFKALRGQEGSSVANDLTDEEKPLAGKKESSKKKKRKRKRKDNQDE